MGYDGYGYHIPLGIDECCNETLTFMTNIRHYSPTLTVLVLETTSSNEICLKDILIAVLYIFINKTIKL